MGSLVRLTVWRQGSRRIALDEVYSRSPIAFGATAITISQSPSSVCTPVGSRYDMSSGEIVGQAGVFGQYQMFVDHPVGVFFVGQALHFVNGIVFAILYGLIARHSLPFNKDTNGGNISKGLLYGVIMTIISAGLLVPYAYVQGNGYGFFLFNGPDGWKLPAGILVWHLIYGYFLGALYQPKDD